MKAVILMAGKGTRMAKYHEGPKQLLPVAGKPIVEYVLDQLAPVVEQFIFVVGGPHEETVKQHFGSGYFRDIPIVFVKQEEQLGLAHAFRTAKDYVGEGRWVGTVGDDIFGPEGMEALLGEELGVLASRVTNPEAFGVLVTDDKGYLVRAVEKPQEFVSDLVWNGAMVMDQDFFTVDVEPSARGEYETADVWMKLMQEKGKKIKVVESEYWFPINDKPQLEEATRKLSGE
jgi:glucose-1-phosphate thymidylyltransferase